jgi:hypothetical protein
MIAFLKDMIAALREGASEGLAEAREEIDADKATKALTVTEQLAALRTRLALAPPVERIVTALAAPYRETFLSELSAAATEERPLIYLLCMELPAKELHSWKCMIARDFAVENAGGAEALTRALIEGARDASEGECAVSLVRACHVAAAAAGLGYADVDHALGWAAPAVAIAAERFTSWNAYGEAFLHGERDAAGSNALGRKVLARTVQRLRDDPASPWRTLSWPTA